MDPECSLPFTQQPAIGTFPEVVQFNPCCHILFLGTHFNIILPSTSRFFLEIFELKFCMNFSYSNACYIFHPPDPSLFHNPNSIWWRIQILKIFIMQWTSDVSIWIMRLVKPHVNFLEKHGKYWRPPVTVTVLCLDFWPPPPNTKYHVTYAYNLIFFTTASRLALGPTQPPNQWVPGALSLGV